jgi:FO synthase
MERIIREAGRVPRQRTTLYGSPDPAQTATSFAAAPLEQVVVATSSSSSNSSSSSSRK